MYDIIIEARTVLIVETEERAKFLTQEFNSSKSDPDAGKYWYCQSQTKTELGQYAGVFGTLAEIFQS
jgi:hypothetical protein